MPILPVLDVLNGQVVRGRAGRRAEYRPLVSRLVPGCNPRTVAEAFANVLGHREVYLADLDAIQGAAPAWDLYAALQRDGARLWLDAGVRHRADARALAEAGIARIIVGLETVTGADELAAIVAEYPERVVFSLDLRAGQPLGSGAGWSGDSPGAILTEAIGHGVRSVIVLDLTRVGMGEGTGTEALLAKCCATWPAVEWIAGGGVCDAEDLDSLRRQGVARVLLASALHDGTLSVADWVDHERGG